MRRGGERWDNEQLSPSGRLCNNSGSQGEATINKETPWVQRRKIHFQGGGHSNRVLFVTPSEWSFLKLEISADYHCRKEMLSSAFWRQLTLFEAKTKPRDSLGLFIQLHSFLLLFVSGSGVSVQQGLLSPCIHHFLLYLVSLPFPGNPKISSRLLSLWSSSTSAFQ